MGECDVSLDNNIIVRDALLVLKNSVGKLEQDEADRYFADVTNDENVSADDALLILKYATGMI